MWGIIVSEPSCDVMNSEGFFSIKMNCYKNETKIKDIKDIQQCPDNNIVCWQGRLKMLNANYNDNDSHEKVTLIKNNYFSNKQDIIVSGLKVFIGE